MIDRFVLRAGAASAVVLLGLAVAWSGDAAPELSARRAEVRCAGAIQHPLQVRVEALDAVRRGGTLRLKVTTSTLRPLGRAEVRLVNAGGATVQGARRVSIGRVRPDRSREAEFVVAVPERGERFLIQFQVSGEGPYGRVSRGATYNILPDGPQQPERVVTNASGERVAEYAARRIEP
jgi:hypothetical protein